MQPIHLKFQAPMRSNHRKPRLTSIQNEGLGRTRIFHLPDRPTQQVYNEMFRKNPTMVPPTWGGTHIDSPPDETRRDPGLAYILGHRVIDLVSLFCLHLHVHIMNSSGCDG
jgi:hypothetical protein